MLSTPKILDDISNTLARLDRLELDVDYFYESGQEDSYIGIMIDCLSKLRGYIREARHIGLGRYGLVQMAREELSKVYRETPSLRPARN